MPSRHLGDNAATSGIAESRTDEHFHQAHISGSYHQRECRPRRADRLGRYSRRAREGTRALLPPHNGGRRRHAGSRQSLADWSLPDHPHLQRAPESRHLAGHLPLRVSQSRRLPQISRNHHRRVKSRLTLRA